MKAQTKWVLIIGGLVSGAIISFIALANRKKNEYTKKSISTESGKEIIITVPQSHFPKSNILIVFGGISYADPSWMLDQMPTDIMYKTTIVFTGYKRSFASLMSIMESEFGKIKKSNIAICGFSAGGLDVQENYSDKYRFVGLIDPSTNSTLSSKKYSKNCHMVYNDNNWSGYPTIKKLLPKLADQIKSYGGSSELVNLTHDKIPNYFFKKHNNKLTNKR